MPQAVFSVRRPAVFLLEGTHLNLGEYLSRVRQQAPVIHAISNYVTANDVANLLLACGASPIMADDPEEAVYITRLSAALALNLGTLSRRRGRLSGSGSRVPHGDQDRRVHPVL